MKPHEVRRKVMKGHIAPIQLAYEQLGYPVPGVSYLSRQMHPPRDAQANHCMDNFMRDFRVWSRANPEGGRFLRSFMVSFFDSVLDEQDLAGLELSELFDQKIKEDSDVLRAKISNASPAELAREAIEADGVNHRLGAKLLLAAAA